MAHCAYRIQSRHGTPSLMSFPKDNEMSCEVRPQRSPIWSLIPLNRAYLQSPDEDCISLISRSATHPAKELRQCTDLLYVIPACKEEAAFSTQPVLVSIRSYISFFMRVSFLNQIMSSFLKSGLYLAGSYCVSATFSFKSEIYT